MQKERIVIKGDPFTEGIPPKSAFVSRGSTTFDIFRGGVPPVETEMGESCCSGRRISWSAVFDMV